MPHKESKKIILVTTTSYKSNSNSDICRSALALNLVKEADKFGYPIIVVDEGSPQKLIDDFRKNHARVYTQEKKGMGIGRRQAFQLAHDSGEEVIVWVEPEKDTFIRYIDCCAEPILKGEAELVIPRRKSLESYPDFQRDSETNGNNFFQEITGTSIDIFFGPRIFRRNLAHYFTDYDGRYGDLWDSINVPIVEMVFNRERTREVIVDYEYPVSQSALESNSPEFYEKRRIQLENTKKSLENHWNLLKSKTL